MAISLDDDVGPRVAVTAPGLGLDVVSAQESTRIGLSDYEQLHLAAADRRILVTCNRDDYSHWTAEFCRGGLAHAGLLTLSRSLPRDEPDRLAHALAGWAARAAGPGGSLISL